MLIFLPFACNLFNLKPIIYSFHLATIKHNENPGYLVCIGLVISLMVGVLIFFFLSFFSDKGCLAKSIFFQNNQLKN